MLNLPIYLRNQTYYLHTRVNGQQIKRSLGTGYKREAIIRAVQLLTELSMPKNNNRLSTYKIDLKNGIFEAEGAEDHQRLIEALKQAQTAQKPPEATFSPSEQETRPKPSKNGLKLNELVENYFKLKKQLSQSTAIAYKAAFAELQDFLKNPNVEDVTQSDLVRFQNFLAEKGNTPRTIDNKNKNIKAVFNFAIDQNLYKEKNPVPKDLMTKKQKLKSGFAIFEREEIKQIFDCDFVRTAQEKDKDYFFVLLLGLFTGCRVGEITTLKKEQFKVSENNTLYIKIRDAKTLAGVREVPIYDPLFEIFKEFAKDKRPEDRLFRYAERDGKGAGNAVGKKFSRHLEEAQVTREKLVFHSLRKFVNNEFLKNKVSVEVRSQFIGHELDNININTYANLLSVDELAEQTQETFKSIAKLISGVFYVKEDNKILRNNF